MLRRSQKVVSITVNRHPDDNEDVWFTNQLLDPLNCICKEMRVLAIDMPSKDIAQYEEANAGSGDRTFRIPDGIVNKCEMSWPTVYSDRGILKING